VIEVYTDGSARGNGKEDATGGFGVVVLNKQNNKLEYSYQEQCVGTTNNREELKAIIKAFELAQTKYSNETCLIYTDSAYCVNICNDWIFKWAKNGWKNSKKQIVENFDLIKILYNYLTIDFFNCQVMKTHGHRGIIENELADALATNDNTKFEKIIKENHIEC
jgi:ribonuclease HI